MSDKYTNNVREGLSSETEILIEELSSFDEYFTYAQANNQRLKDNYLFELEYPQQRQFFSLEGHCTVCKEDVTFNMDDSHVVQVGDDLEYNWRERTICSKCQLNSRVRAALFVFQSLYNRSSNNKKIYITEQTTSLYTWLVENFDDVVGSEFLTDGTNRGQVNSDGTRYEDLTQLSFKENSLSYILSFDVLEHIPNHRQALTECLKSLEPGGRFMFSVPFISFSPHNTLRSYYDVEENLLHLLEPEYHGDPINDNGCLCYRTFGWELLDEMRNTGFVDVRAIYFWSKDLGFLGGQQMIIVGRKPGPLKGALKRVEKKIKSLVY